MNYIMYKIIKFIGTPLFRLIYLPRSYGTNNIPKNGSVILAGNHTSVLDALIMVSTPKRTVHMMAKKELFESKFTNFFFRNMGCIPVNRSIHDKDAKNEAVEVLKNNEVLGIFPEGTVNKTNEIVLPFKYGAVSFAKKTNAYIVPFAITGKYKIFRRSIKITYGKPYKVKQDLEVENNRLMNTVKRMIKEGNDKN